MNSYLKQWSLILPVLWTGGEGRKDGFMQAVGEQAAPFVQAVGTCAYLHKWSCACVLACLLRAQVELNTHMCLPATSAAQF